MRLIPEPRSFTLKTEAEGKVRPTGVTYLRKRLRNVWGSSVTPRSEEYIHRSGYFSFRAGSYRHWNSRFLEILLSFDFAKLLFLQLHELDVVVITIIVAWKISLFFYLSYCISFCFLTIIFLMQTGGLYDLFDLPFLYLWIFLLFFKFQNTPVTSVLTSLKVRHSGGIGKGN